MAVELALRIGVLRLGVLVLALGHELEREGRTGNGDAGREGGDAGQVRVANAQAAQLTGAGGAADVLEGFHVLLGRALDVGCVGHYITSLD